MKREKVYLLDKNNEVQYGLNWGQRENRDPDQSYLQLTPDIYRGDFFPKKGKYFIVNTDDGEIIIFTRAQKDLGCALQTPENNAILGKYIRKRLGLAEGSEITKDDIQKYGRSDIDFEKVDDMHYNLYFGINHSKGVPINLSIPEAIKATNGKYESEKKYLRAIRTKPFLLLAGISGTGKSRIVKQMAFDSCPIDAQLREDPTSPGNYCLVEVKPNWHDSTELLGYESKIGGDHYQLTPFVKFLAKAMLYPKTPFFVCLDEMNLAPVEQYFAEFLSVLESRTKIETAPGEWHIVSEPLIKASIFANPDYESKLKHLLFNIRIKEKDDKEDGIRIYEAELDDNEKRVYEILKKGGLRIPENVIVVGTVNMDETTHQFSRKVIDRAMTIEMNLPDGDPFMDFFNNGSELAYRQEPTSASLYLATETRAADVIKALEAENPVATKDLKRKVSTFLTELNKALDNTPFKIAYRVQNELILYFYQTWLEDPEADWNEILTTACDRIMMMKVLPRVEGDDELLEGALKKGTGTLWDFVSDYPDSREKVREMSERLEKSRFASFWP